MPGYIYYLYGIGKRDPFFAMFIYKRFEYHVTPGVLRYVLVNRGLGVQIQLQRIRKIRTGRRFSPLSDLGVERNGIFMQDISECKRVSE